MDQNLVNAITASGTYDGSSVSLTSNTLTVNMVSGLTATISADKLVWIDGMLTYTITIDNQASKDFETPVVSDVIDTTLVNFVDGSVLINDVQAQTSQYNYDEGTHTLTVNLDTIIPTGTSTIKFQVSKAE